MKKKKIVVKTDFCTFIIDCKKMEYTVISYCFNKKSKHTIKVNEIIKY